MSDERGMPCRMKNSVLPYLECYQIEKESVTKILLRLDGVFEQRKHKSSMQYRGTEEAEEEEDMRIKSVA